MRDRYRLHHLTSQHDCLPMLLILVYAAETLQTLRQQCELCSSDALTLD